MNYIYVNGELYHHGIKGQKWGVRRWQNADGTYNSAGKKRYFGEGSGENYKSVSSGKQNNSSAEKEHKGLTDKQKKALKIGAAVAGTALVAYGAYKLNDKATKALVDSYSKVGAINIKSSWNHETMALRDLQSAHLANNRQSTKSSLTNEARKFVSSAYGHKASGRIDRLEGERLQSIARSKNFSNKERAKAAVGVLTKGSKGYTEKKTLDLLGESIGRTTDIKQKMRMA